MRNLPREMPSYKIMYFLLGHSMPVLKLVQSSKLLHVQAIGKDAVYRNEIISA
jgi:hypothetical protein